MTKAKEYKFGKNGRGDTPLDQFWSATNGMEAFGHIDKDPQMRRVWKQYGETWPFEGSPRLALWRLSPGSNMWAEVYHYLQIRPSEGDCPVRSLAAVHEAVSGMHWFSNSNNPLAFRMVDFDSTMGYDSDNRFELQFSYAIPVPVGKKDLTEEISWMKDRWNTFFTALHKGLSRRD